MGIFLSTAFALAQSVRWEPPGGQLGFNQISELALVFEDCEPEGAPVLPKIDGLTFGRPSQTSETSMSNFTKITRRYSLVYPVRAEKRANVSIPGFEVKTDSGPKQVPAATYTVGDTTVGGTGLAVGDIAGTQLTVPKNTFWAGEVFPVTFTMSVVRRYFHSPVTFVEWQPAPLIAEEWSKAEPSEPVIRGERRLVATQTTRAYAKEPGSITTKPASQIVNLVVGQTGFGLFATASVEQRILATDPLKLTIRPLPPAPAGFAGAVGQFTLVSKIVPTTPAVGEPVTWTLEFSGTGNWPDIGGLPQREVSSDFSVVQPKSKRSMKDNSLFEGSLTEDVVLVPTKPGRYTLGPVRVTYFDTASGTYKTLSSEPVMVTVAAGTAAPAQAPSQTPQQFQIDPATAPRASAPDLPASVAPVAPENLPRDPLPLGADGIAPRTLRSMAVLSIALAVGVPLIVWLWLAALRSRALDPEKSRRASYAALSEVLARIRAAGSSPAALAALLQSWQHHSAALWRIPHAAPGSPLVEKVVARNSNAAAPAWSSLWTDADRALHGRDVALPSDWTLRAEAALQAVRVPGWSPVSLFSPRHLLPCLGILLILGPCLAQAGADDDYRAGKFPAAERAWRETVASAPQDWAARHNLGLALAQQDRWGEAAAQWTSAFLLNARNQITRWDLSLGLQRSGMAPPELVEFSRGEGRYKLARAASPGEWQLALVLAAVLLALMLVLLLLRSYGRAGAWARNTAVIALVLAILLATAATLSLHTYGHLANPNAVLVWREATLRSIPTDADSQKVTALSAGSLAVADKTFLGWSRLQFAGGQTGWVRSGDLVRLYK